MVPTRLILFFTYLFCSFYSPPSLEGASAKEIISKIPLSDRDDLEFLFFKFVNGDHFGYTLFGDKPVSLSAFFYAIPWENIVEKPNIRHLVKKDWDVWEKYKDQFNIKKFILSQESSLIHQMDFILLINKEALKKAIIQYKKTFESILNKKIDPEEFVRDLESGKSLGESIQQNDVLWGLLLGYGKHNAVFFSQRGKILKMSCLITSGDNRPTFQRVRLPRFLIDPNHPYTDFLNKKYAKMRQKLSSIYSNGNFFTVSLLKLTE